MTDQPDTHPTREETRIEHDLLGDLPVAADAYWGVHTQRALQNFDISRTKIGMHHKLVNALAAVKAQVALTIRPTPLPEALRGPSRAGCTCLSQIGQLRCWHETGFGRLPVDGVEKLLRAGPQAFRGAVAPETRLGASCDAGQAPEHLVPFGRQPVIISAISIPKADSRTPVVTDFPVLAADPNS